ncbi:DNA-directed DNA polymerase [Tanacetum coccineum]
MDEANRSVASYFLPSYTSSSCCTYGILVTRWKITCRGTTNEEPYGFISEFFSIADTHEITGLTKDDIRLQLFSYTLKDRAKHWFNSLPRQSVTTWADMQKLFLEEFYPISKTSDVRNKIKSFRQIPGELFHESFERLNDLLRSCPHHDIPKWELVKIFYDSLDASNRQFLLAASGGLFLTHPSDEEWTFFGTLRKGSKTQASVDRNNNPSSSINVISESTSFQKEARTEISDMNRKIDLLIQNFGREEQVNEVYRNRQQYDMNSNTYHSGWRNHPNLRYGNTSNILNPGTQVPYQGQQRVPYQQNSGNFQVQNRNQGRHGELSLEQKMEQLVGQLADQVHTRLPGTLPGTTQLNPQHKASSSSFNSNNAQVNEVTILRSGKVYDNKVCSPTHIPVEGVAEDYVSDEEEESTLLGFNNQVNHLTTSTQRKMDLVWQL